MMNIATAFCHRTNIKRKQGKLLFPRMVMKKWLNINSTGEGFSADEFSDDEHEESKDPDIECESEFEYKSKIFLDCMPFKRPSDSIKRKEPEKPCQHVMKKDELRITVGTWNVGAVTPSPGLDLKDWLDLDNPADIYVLGFQEIVPLNAGNVFVAEDSAPTVEWQSLIRKTLSDEDDCNKPLLSGLYAEKNPLHYVCVASKQMVGIHISVWVKRKLRRYIHNLKVSSVGLGIMGCLGNKGSISVSMLLHKTSFCFICSHLTAGGKEGDKLRRNADVAEILRRTRFPSTKKVHIEVPKTILQHDRIIWLGDLNYRLNLIDSHVRLLVAREDWTALLAKDQLRKELSRGLTFDGWHEGTISFAPTYKYETESHHYSGHNAKAGEKLRTPAWCDRILWYGKGLRQLSYGRQEYTLSDHRPVMASFMAEVDMLTQNVKKPVHFRSAKVAVEELLSVLRNPMNAYKEGAFQKMAMTRLNSLLRDFFVLKWGKVSC